MMCNTLNNTFRRLFPSLDVFVRGLDPIQQYNITLRIVPVDNYRYKFLNMEWTKAGNSDVSQNKDRQVYLHPESPNSGGFWMRKQISFRQLKITHNPNCKNAHVS